MVETKWTPVLVPIILAAVVVLLALFKVEASWAVAVVTVALVSATWLLGQHTRNLTSETTILADATRELATIEERRDLRNRLERAITAAEAVREIDMNQYIEMLQRGHAHEGFAQRVFGLAKFADLVSDGDTRRTLTQWRNWLDAHLGRTDWSIGANGPQMRKEYSDIQDRLQGEITAWRDSIVSPVER